MNSNKKVESAVFWGIVKAFFALTIGVPAVIFLIFAVKSCLEPPRSFGKIDEISARIAELAARAKCENTLPTSTTDDQMFDCIQQKLSERNK